MFYIPPRISLKIKTTLNKGDVCRTSVSPAPPYLNMRFVHCGKAIIVNISLPRSLAIILAVVGVSLASEASFLNFAKTFNKKYGSTEEYNKRRAIFLENYNSMVRHNQEYEEGKVSWWRKVTEHYDLTAEEREAVLNLGNISVKSEIQQQAPQPPQVCLPWTERR